MQIEHKKNTPYYLAFPMVDSATPANFKTGLSPVDTAYYKDGAGAWTSLAITDTASEIASTGVYEIDLAAGEMNHDQVLVKFAVAGAADTAFLFDMRTKLVSDLNLTASGNIGIDWANVENPTTAVDLSATDIQLCDTATDVTNRVEADMTYIHGSALTETAGQLAGRFVDFFDQALATFSVATALSSFKADVSAVAVEANVQGHCNDALLAQNLDHLMKVAVDTDIPTTVHLDSVFGYLMDAGTSWTYTRATDSQEQLGFAASDTNSKVCIIEDAVALLPVITDITSTGQPIALHTDDKVLLAGTTHTGAVVPEVSDTIAVKGLAPPTDWNTLTITSGSVTLTSAYDAAKTAASASDVNAQVLDVVNVDVLVAGVTVAEALRRIGARAAGTISGAGTGTETITDWAGSASTLVYTVDTSGNISTVVFN